VQCSSVAGGLVTTVLPMRCCRQSLSARTGSASSGPTSAQCTGIGNSTGNGNGNGSGNGDRQAELLGDGAVHGRHGRRDRPGPQVPYRDRTARPRRAEGSTHSAHSVRGTHSTPGTHSTRSARGTHSTRSPIECLRCTRHDANPTRNRFPLARIPRAADPTCKFAQGAGDVGDDALRGPRRQRRPDLYVDRVICTLTALLTFSVPLKAILSTVKGDSQYR
jgi:hypothetical protein